MPKINLLDKNVAELIAAGEVIDRPASLVKELIENSIDADSSSITVEIINGGISFIRVTDNGCGISHNELPTAFLRHATSKVYKENDLEHIATMGFRGEALASAAAVARVEIMSKTLGSQKGGSYKIEGGQEVSHDESGCPVGTTVIIRDLFFNTPARLKFLKKDVSEGNAVQAVVDRLAIIHPEISFRFVRDNKPVRITSGDGKLYSAIYSIFGRQFAESLIPVDYLQNNVSISGFVSSPLFPRGNRTMQYFYVNRRFIKSLSVMAAVESGFHGSIMTGKFPAGIINIGVDFSQVDVNVHPAKTEVRFSDENKIFDTVYFAVKNAILNADNKKPVSLKSKMENSPDCIPERNSQNISLKQDSLQISKGVVLHSYKSPYSEKTIVREPYKFVHKTIENQNVQENINTERQTVREIPKLAATTMQEGLSESESNCLTMIGELFKTYILCQSEDKFILIDKHAAHERLKFERLKKELINSSQLLAGESIIEMDSSYVEAIGNAGEILSDIGFDIIKVDDYRVQVAAMPSILIDEDLAILVSELAEIIKRGTSDVSVIFDDILHTIACKSAIKANDKNDADDLAALANAVWENKTIRFCPHGRPIVLTLKKYQIEKMFGRS